MPRDTQGGDQLVLMLFQGQESSLSQNHCALPSGTNPQNSIHRGLDSFQSFNFLNAKAELPKFWEVLRVYIYQVHAFNTKYNFMGKLIWR